MWHFLLNIKENRQFFDYYTLDHLHTVVSLDLLTPRALTSDFANHPDVRKGVSIRLSPLFLNMIPHG